jgi:hypothetical protein
MTEKIEYVLTFRDYDLDKVQTCSYASDAARIYHRIISGSVGRETPKITITEIKTETRELTIAELEKIAQEKKE